MQTRVTSAVPEGMGAIEILAREFAVKRETLKTHVDHLEADVAELKRRKVPLIRRAVAAAMDARDLLRRAIERAPHLFVKPKTVVLHGIKVGFQKGRGAIEVADEARTIALIRKHYPDQVETLVRTKETLVRDALAQLPAKDLARLGVEVRDVGDEVVVRPQDGDVDRLVNALLRDIPNADEE